MDWIRDVTDWLSTETINVVATLFPLAMIGLLGLYLLWLVIGYLRVSQVGIDKGSRPAVALPGPAGDGGLPEPPRGVPYCAFDGLQYPAGARFCTQCERDLSLDCTNCGATLTAGATSCYRCGTPTGTDSALLD